MLCERARRVAHERRLDAADPAEARALDTHLEACAGCREEQRVEAGITAALGELHRPYPRPIDVTARVMHEIERLGPVEPREVPDRHIAWGAAAAVIAAALLAAAAIPFLSHVPAALGVLGALARGTWTVVADLAAPAAQVLSTPFRVLGSTTTLRALATDVVPVLSQTVTVALLMAAATTAVVVGRDLLRRRLGAGAHGLLA